MHAVTDESFEEIVVAPRSARRETVGVLLTIAGIVALCAVRFALLSRAGGEREVAAGPSLSPADATIFQSLIVAAESVASLREADGRWPSPARLQSEGLPPFEPALLPQDLRGYRWEEYARGAGVDYVGQEAGSRGRASFLLRLEDSEPAGQGKTSSLLVEVWTHPRRDPRVVDALGSAGWTRLVSLEGRAGTVKRP